MQEILGFDYLSIDDPQVLKDKIVEYKLFTYSFSILRSAFFDPLSISCCHFLV